MAERSKKRRLLKEIVCPHCWTTFPTEDVLWISESPSLIGDVKLGELERSRFLPTIYDAQGIAVDAQGYKCKDLACPHCHLKLPSAVLEAPTIFMSIVGAPASGKSYYLASSTWFLRKILPRRFNVNYADADPEMNRRLQEYESLQFLNEADKIVSIEKTEEQGDLYNSVQLDNQIVSFPQPFVFLVSPTPNHPNVGKIERLSRTVCLYDNAGESYLPTRDADSSSLPVTRHLAQSACVFFLFDPTQDVRFQTNSNEQSSTDDKPRVPFRRSPIRQEAVFAEMARRLRSYRRLGSTELYDRPLIVVVTKFDEWRDLLPTHDLIKDPVSTAMYQGNEYSFLRMDRVQRISTRVRAVLVRRTPEFVAAVDSFAKESYFIPVSATGVPPTLDPATNRVGFRPKDMSPIWIVTPMLFALARLTKGIIPAHDKEGINRPGENQ